MHMCTVYQKCTNQIRYYWGMIFRPGACNNAIDGLEDGINNYSFKSPDIHHKLFLLSPHFALLDYPLLDGGET